MYQKTSTTTPLLRVRQPTNYTYNIALNERRDTTNSSGRILAAPPVAGKQTPLRVECISTYFMNMHHLCVEPCRNCTWHPTPHNLWSPWRRKGGKLYCLEVGRLQDYLNDLEYLEITWNLRCKYWTPWNCNIWTPCFYFIFLESRSSYFMFLYVHS